MEHPPVEIPTHLILLSSLLVAVAVGTAVVWLGPAWDNWARRYIANLRPKLVALGMDSQQVTRAMRWWGIALFGVATFFGVVLAMPPVAIGVTYCVFIAPRFILDNLIRKRKMLLRDQMVRASAGLANAARAGLSLPQGIQNVAQETPQPLAAELKRIARDYHAGRPLSDSIREVEERLDIEAFTVFANAVLVCLERGGRVTYALDRISTGLQEMQRLERKMDADTAAGRKLALVLGLFPIAFLIGFSVLDPVNTGYLYSTVIGQCVLLTVGVLIYVALRWCMAILDVDF